jgi:tellurite resistance protein TehA-like permease
VKHGSDAVFQRYRHLIAARRYNDIALVIWCFAAILQLAFAGWLVFGFWRSG